MNYKLPNERKTKQIIFNCTEDFFEELNDFCEENHTTKSRLIRKLLTHHMWEVDNNKTYETKEEDY